MPSSQLESAQPQHNWRSNHRISRRPSWLIASVLCLPLLEFASAFRPPAALYAAPSPTKVRPRSASVGMRLSDADADVPSATTPRRAFLSSLVAMPAVAAAGAALSFPRPSEALPEGFFDAVFKPFEPSKQPPPAPKNGFITKSGVIFSDFEQGTGPTPRWGQFVSAFVEGYMKTDRESAPVQYFSSQAELKGKYGRGEMLMHHGNGRTIRGLEEAIHTMRAGGRRRVIVPANNPILSYFATDERAFMPAPFNFMQRYRYERLLSQMQPDGQFIFDVKLVKIFDNEADQGYFEDEILDIRDERVQKQLIRAAEIFEEAKAQKLPIRTQEY